MIDKYQKTQTNGQPSLEDEALPSNDLGIHLKEHWGIVARTGAGKTVFVMKGLVPYLRSLYPKVPVYILDSTDDEDILDMLPDAIQVTGNHVPDLLQQSGQVQVWTPRNSKLPNEYNTWFEMLNDNRMPAIVVLDEIASITGKALGGLEALFKQMRKHGGTVIAETQRIAKVDSDVFSQLTHYVQMSINPEQYDLQMARSYLRISKEEQRNPRYKHGGFYRRTDGDFPLREFRDYSDFFR